MAIVGSTLLADKTRTGMRPHAIFAVNADQDEIAGGAVTLAYLYRQLGMASRAGCKTIAGCLTLLQTWIYEYFPTFRPHHRQADEPNKTRAEMWSTKKPCREVERLRECRSILDCMTKTQVLYITSHFNISYIFKVTLFLFVNLACMQVEWTPYISAPRALLNEHPRTTFIGDITCFDIIGVYMPERTVGRDCAGYSPRSYLTSEGYATGTRYLLRDICFFGCLLGGME